MLQDSLNRGPTRSFPSRFDFVEKTSLNGTETKEAK